MQEAPEAPPPPAPRSCGAAGGSGRPCWSVDLRVAVLLLTLAAAVILLLIYKLLQLRLRLRLARAPYGLEYRSFYHSATYRLKPTHHGRETPAPNGKIPEDTPPIQAVATATPAPPPLPLPLPPTPVAPPPRVLSLPLIHAAPPSPHPSWGACSDADVYSRIGAFRTSRLSTVILFEHSAL